MNVKKLLLHRYINNAAIAADLFPNQRYPKQTLNNKFYEVIAGTGRQRLIDKDISNIYALFERFLEEVQYRGRSRPKGAAAPERPQAAVPLRPQEEYQRKYIIRKEQFAGGGWKFYPVHMENEELSYIINQLLEDFSLYGNSTVQVCVRKDRGAKGVDFRIRITSLWDEEVHRNRQYAFGINSNWEVEGFFDHWSDINGKPAAEEIVGRQMPVLEQVLRARATRDWPPVRNKLFDGDNWTCVYEQRDRLSG